LARRGADIDQIVRARTEKGRDILAADYIELLRLRAQLVRAMDARLAGLDVLAMPTTATVAPRIDEVANPKSFMARNATLLRNPTIVNFFDLCAISLPLPRAGALPTGLMLIARNGHDRRLFEIAAAVERRVAA
jgi:aspartyl-tRNA(Asn)/glutamyl-tRNA(Gln) amidotransferase subunit A